MKFKELLAIVGQEPVFETGLLLSGRVSPSYLRRQLSDWVRTGKLWQLRRGLYMLAPPYQKVPPHPFLIANRLLPGSAVSLQAALAYYSLIPEHVAVVTSVTTRRPGTWDTPLGTFIFRHLKSSLLFGIEYTAVSQGQHAFVAMPEKALLDLIYLQPEGDTLAYLTSLRLQNLDRLNVTRLYTLVEQWGKPKLFRAAAVVAEFVDEEANRYERL